MNPDKRDELYNNLINSGKVSEAEIGSLDDFKAAITDEESARLFHQNLMGSGLFGADEIGSEDDFYSSISSDFAGTDVPQQPATSAAQGLAVNPYTMQPTAVRAPFADVQAAQQYEQQKPTSPTQPTNPAAAQNEQEQPLGPERFAKQMQMEQQLGQMSQDFTNRMEAIRKGNQPFGSGHQREFNPETGRMEDVYYTKAGERTNTPLAQWEENNKGLRLQQDIDQSLSALDGAAEAAWKTATEASGKEQSENIKMIARTGGFMPGGSGMGQLAMLNTASHLKYHDLQRMADDAWNSLGIVKQQAMIDGIYNTLRSHHYNDEASDEQLRAEAEAMARQENDRRLFDYAVKMNAPKDATDYFFRKALQNNAITMLKDFAARSMAGTTGDWEARDVAEQQYDMESLGHNLIGHAGGITGFLLDPTVLIGGAAAKGAVGGATKIAGKLAAKRGGAAWVAENAPTLIGKTTTGVVAGAGNFGTFESAQEALRQLRWGGKIEIDEKTGRYKIDGYDLGEVAKKFGHGALMGGTIGVLGPLTGNVGDRLVGYINKNGKPGTVANIMDKLGARTVQTGVCKTAEGTIFSIPEWIDTYKKYGEMIDAVSDPESKNYIADDYQRAKKIEELKAERAAEVMDTWTENEKMMLGFGLQHMVKSIPQRISELRDIDNARTMEERNHNRRDWLSKLNRMLDGRPDLALTRDEKDELQRRGYTDLADLVSEYKRWEDEKAVTEKARPDAIDANRMIGEGEDAAIPYNRFLQLMEDPTVSEAARAKMYYYLTGRQAPMSTVMGWSPIEEVKDANGKVTGYNVKSLGAKGVITSRTFADKAAAEAELQKIYRQAELNTLDIGERYYEGRGLSSEDLRDYVGKRHGVDVDASIRKDPNRRSKAEQEAVDEYTERLYVGVKTEEAYQRGYDADEQGRQDAMMELAMSDPSDPDHTEKQATVDGINQRINDDADMQVAQQREEAKVRTNKNDGAIHPATLIETDANGNPKEVFVVDGDFSMDADGNITGDETIVVYDPLEGKNRMVSPRDIAELGEVTTAEQQEQNIETNKQAYIQQQQDAATGRFNPQPGQEIDMPDGGKAVVLATDGDSVTLQMPDGTQQSMAIADIQQIADGVMMEDYRQRHPDTAAAEQPAAEAPAITEGKPETFEPNMELTIKDGEGEKTVYVTGTRARWEAGKFVEDPNGKFVELYDPEANGGNGGMTYIREDDPDGKIVGHRPMEQPAAEQTETPTEITEQAPEQPTENEQPTEAPTEEVQQPEPAVAPEAEIYNNVKGEYPEAYRDKVENTVKIKAKRVTDTKTALDKATAALTATEYGSKEEATAKRKRDEAQQAYDAAVADSEMWNAVKSLKDQELLAEREAKDAAEREERERRRAETEAARKREQEAYEVEMARRKAEQEEKDRRTEAALEYMAKMRDEAAAMGAGFPIEDDAAAMEVMNDLEPHTLEEVAAWLLSDTKGKMKIDPEEMRRHTGYSSTDMNKFPFIFKKDGVSPEKFGEHIEQKARENGVSFDEADTNAGFNALLNVLGEVGGLGDLKNYIKDARRVQAERLHSQNVAMAAAVQTEDDWIAQHGGMSREEYASYINWMEDAMEQGKTEITDEEFNQIFNTDDTRTATTDEESQRGGAAESGTDGAEARQAATAADDTRRGGEDAGGESTAPTAVAERIAAAEAQTDTNPTEGQKKAGNYAKGHLTLDGYNISIEQPKGSIRRGVDAAGRAWEQEMHNTYGYIRGTEGVDGDHIDVFLSDDPTQGNVFVIDQVNKDGSFDEHKVMYGFPDAESARAAYLSNYEEGWQGLGTITEVSKDEFKKWVESSHRKTKPFSEYKSVKPDGAQAEQRQPGSAGAPADTTDEEAMAARMAVNYDDETTEEGPQGTIYRRPIVIDGIHRVEQVDEPDEKGHYTGSYYMYNGKRYGDLPDVFSYIDSNPAPKEEASITPTQYTTKKGKVLDMQLVKFDKELTKEQFKAAKEIARKSMGWWSAADGGFLMRSEDAARQLVDSMSDKETVADEQPVSLEDMNTVADVATMDAIDEAAKEEEKPQSTPQYNNDIEDEAYETRLKSLHDQYKDTLPTVQALERKIRGFENRAKLIEEELANATDDNDRAMSQTRLANINGYARAHRTFLDEVRKKASEKPKASPLEKTYTQIKEKYPDKTPLIRVGDFYETFGEDAKQVAETLELPLMGNGVTGFPHYKLEQYLPKLIRAGKRVAVVDQLEAPRKDGADSNRKTDNQTEEDTYGANNQFVSRERYEELKKRMREKLNRLNVGIDPEILALGSEMAVFHLEAGARKFVDFAKRMIADMGDAIRPYLKAFYNAGRDMPEMENRRDEFTPHDEVSRFDVLNFDKEGPKDIVEMAKNVVKEQELSQQVEQAKSEIKTQRNEQRKEKKQDKKKTKPTTAAQSTLDFPKDYRDYMTPEAKERYAKDPQFEDSIHPELNYIVAASLDGVNIPYDVLSKLPEVIAAEQEVRDAQKNGKLKLTAEQIEASAQRLLGEENGSAVLNEKGKTVGYTGEVKNERKAFIVIGRPAAGKSKVFADPLSRKNKARIIDSDTVKPWLEGYNNGDGADYVHEASGKIADRALELAAQRGENIVIPKLGQSQKTINIAVALRLAGYDVQLYFNDLPEDTSITQALARYAQEGRFLSLEFLTDIDGKISNIFSTFAQNSLKDYFNNERTSEYLQDLRGRLGRLLGSEEESGKRLRQLSAALGRGNSKTYESLQEMVGDGGLQATGDGLVALNIDEPIFSYVEWKSNNVRLGEQPKEIWNSASGEPMPNAKPQSNDRTRKDQDREPEGNAADMGEDGTRPDGGQQAGTLATPAEGGEAGGMADADAEGEIRDADRTVPARVQRPGSGRDSSQGPAGRVSAGNVLVDPTVEHGDTRTDNGSDLTPKEKNTPLNTRNYLYPANASAIDDMPPMERMKTNVAALEVLRTLLREGRDATPAERATMGKLRGWGGINVPNTYEAKYRKFDLTPLQKQLVEIIDELDPDGKKGLLESLNTAALTSYYTPIPIAQAMHSVAEMAGYKGGGTMLDPSMGNGVFEGTMKKGVQQSTQIRGCELDWLTGQIAKRLYPDARVNVSGFQDAHVPENYYDYVVSNIPFGSLQVTDLEWEKNSSPIRKAAQGKIHNYFAVKMVESTRPGGLCVIMTSNAIMDTQGNAPIRKYIADNCEILGAVRLPNNTFKGAGTRVVTDVIYLRKFRDEADRLTVLDNGDYNDKVLTPFLTVNGKKLADRIGSTKEVKYNSYFQVNPQNVVGEIMAGGQYSDDAFDLRSEYSTDELAKQITKLGKKFIDQRKKRFGDTIYGTTVKRPQIAEAVREAYKGNGNYEGQGNIIVQDGKIGRLESVKEGSGKRLEFVEQPIPSATTQQVQDYVGLRSLLKELIAAQIEGRPEAETTEIRKRMQAAYENYTKQHGQLLNKKNAFIADDIDGFQVRALEKWKDGKFQGMADIYTKNTISARHDINTVGTPQDAVLNSLSEYGYINNEYMERVLGSKWAEDCGDLVFEDPSMPGNYIMKDSYLSGDVVSKLEQAQKMAIEDPRWQRNVDALQEVQPKRKEYGQFPCHMGARWVPVDVYNDFLKYVFDIHEGWRGTRNGIVYDESTCSYLFNFDESQFGGKSSEYRTNKKKASEIFEAALLDKDITIRLKDDEGKDIGIDQEATDAARAKVEQLREEFEDWVVRDKDRVNLLTDTYNNIFNRHVLPTYNGSHLHVAGLQGKELRPHQKDAVWRIINQRGGIIDHAVGAGKSLVMMSSIMEMRRMGIAKKPMIVALKSTTAQIANEFRATFPAARVLAPSEKDFSTQNRKKFLAQIAVNDYDCVILSHEQYSQLDHSDDIKRLFITDQVDQIDNLVEYLYGKEDQSQLTKKQIKGLQKRKENLMEKLKKLDLIKTDQEFVFENLGVDYLFVDECQAFKNLMFQTSYSRIAGLGNPEGSERSTKMLYGIRALQEMHQGDMGTVFLSGTTISNSLSELYNIFNYLRPNEMRRMGLNTFDAWASTFAVRSTEAEFGVTNELKEKSRFRKFEGLQELSRLYTEIADVRNDSNLVLPKPKAKTHFVAIPISDTMKEINAAIVDMVQRQDGSYFGINPAVKDKYPWSLAATNLAKKATLSPKLIDEMYDDENGKITHMCENVKKIYDKFNDQKGTQLIFCDSGVPGAGKTYDAYSDMINRLTEQYGIPRNEIADIHVAKTDEQRADLFKKVKDGTIRILIGGTKNMGTGVNVQNRVVAMHHLDIPWTPADVNQRNGRGSRQGNTVARDFNNNEVDVYYYAVEQTLDTYRYQLQDVKGKMIDAFKTANVGVDEFDEGGDAGDEGGAMNAAEMVAILSGNPVILDKAKQDKLVEKLNRLKRTQMMEHANRQEEYRRLQQEKSRVERLISYNKQDIERLKRNGFEPDKEGKWPQLKVTVDGKVYDKAKEAGEAIHNAIKKNGTLDISSYGIPAKMTVEEKQSSLFDTSGIERKLVADTDTGILYTVNLSDDATAAGQSMQNLLKNIYHYADAYAARMEEINHKLDGAEVGEFVFAKQAELDEAIERKREIDAEYNKLVVSDHRPSAPAESETGDDVQKVREKEVGYGRGTYTTKDGVQLSMMSLFEEGNLNDNANLNERSSANGDLTELRLRKLEPGETCHVERRYEENKSFSFTGKEKIESMDDVAYIFKQLENAAVENSFIALVKDGKPIIIHTGMGGYASSPVDIRQAVAAYMSINPEQVYFVHNHPSGSLRASREDRLTLNLLREVFGNDVVQDGIIIDTTSGKYGVFGPEIGEGEFGWELGEKNRGEVPMKVYEFSKQVFSKDWKPQTAYTIAGYDGVAEFISSHRLGEHPKMSFIVVNNQNQVVGNLFLPWTALSEIEDVKATSTELSNYINLAGGTKGVIYGNYQYSEKDKRMLQQLAAGMNLLHTPLLDVVHVDVNDELGYHSAHDSGVMKPEAEYVTPAREAGESILDYAKRVADDYSAYESIVKALEVANGGVMEAHDDSVSDIMDDQSMGMQERMTAMATKIAALHADDAAAKNRAYRAIGGNLADLRKAMSLQKEFDRSTVKRVADLARVLLSGGYLDNLSRYEVGRLLSAVKNATGRSDIRPDLKKVMDIMVDNQLKRAEKLFHDLETVKAKKVNAKGVEVIGELDIAGQQIVEAFKKGRKLDKDNIEQKIADAQQRMGSDNKTIADEAANEYTGLQYALEYAQIIKESVDEEHDLLDELEQARLEARNPEGVFADKEAYDQYRASVEEALRQNRVERLQAYLDLAGRLSGNLSQSIANAMEFKEAEKERIADIQHNANSDMEGRPSNEHYTPDWKAKAVNNSFAQFFLQPLATFDQMLRLFGSKSANGEGYLYNRFMRGWVDARQKEISGVRQKYAMLDDKVHQLFGNEAKNTAQLIRRIGSLPKMTVQFWDGGAMKDHTLTQGNLMYMYMVDKMTDGRMKLRSMGVKEEDMVKVTKALDPRLKELADWLQDYFLVETRNEYNETHKRLFGASMAAIENYFPLKILANARADKPEDLDNPKQTEGISTSTGSIIKRRRNALALDILGADAINVVLDHIAQMEHWNAYAEFNRDLNTLRTYKRFRNQVQNMTTVYGSGKELWKKFNDVSQIAAGSYRPPRATLDEAAVNIAKGVTAAKVSFRVFTALKQFLSMPAYLPDARPDLWAKNLTTPWNSWSWAMDNLPIFEERWKSRMAGDPRLLKSELDWKGWRNNIVQMASRIGMAPNAFVDALTVSIGAKTIYETRRARYLKEGYNEEQADQRARQDAEIAYNETQQSSEGAFLSSMQVDRSWLSVMFTVFRNSSMAYQRQLHDALRNLKRDLRKGNREQSIEFMAKQLHRDGLSEDKAQSAAKNRYNRQIGKDLLRVATFGYILQLAWNLGAKLPYLLFGADDDKKKEMMDDVWAQSMFGWGEGISGGDVFSQGGMMLVQGKGNPEYLMKEMPIASDAKDVLQEIGQGKYGEVVNDLVNLVVQAGIGVNPQSITDAVLAIMDACGDDPALAHEATIAVMRILQVPQSQIKEMYFDELGLSGSEVSNYTPQQLVERYAQYQVKRGRLLAPWTWDDESILDKERKKATKVVKERVGTFGDEFNEALNGYEQTYNEVKERINTAYNEAKQEHDYVKKAQIIDEVRRSDEQAFTTYDDYKRFDKQLDDIVTKYLAAKTPEQASLAKDDIFGFKSRMVDLLGTADEKQRRRLRFQLDEYYRDFKKEYEVLKTE